MNVKMTLRRNSPKLLTILAAMGDGIYSIRNGESHTKSTVTYSGGGGSKRRGFDCA